MAKEKSESVSSDRYDMLHMDNLAYMNMTEQEEYLNPIHMRSEGSTSDSSGAQSLKTNGTGAERKPRALPETPSQAERYTPPPQKRNTPSPPKSVTPAPPPKSITPPPPKRDMNLSGKLSEDNGSKLLNNSSSLRYPRMGNGFASLERNPGKEKVLLKQKNSAFDSGVGDLENIHIDGMNQNKNYDYADYGHQYEELPNRKSIAKCPMDNGMDSRSEFYQSSGGATDIASETDDTANIVNHRSDKRKRVNPLYDQMTQSMPSIYNKTKSSNDGELRKQVRCLKCAIIVLFVLLCAAIAVSVFAVITYNQSKHDPDPLLTPKVQKLTSDYTRLENLLSSFDDGNDTMKILSDLIDKVKTVESYSKTQIEALNTQLASTQHGVLVNLQNIEDLNTNVTDNIASLNMTLQLQLHNISKQEGPQGPQGVANFSQCSYYNHSSEAVASDRFPSYSIWLPTEVDLDTNIGLFAFCSIEGGEEDLLEIHAISPQKVQYRCRCTGYIGESRRTCTVHVLRCPRYS
ncbi:uncharacterized protein LOC132715689 isoform X2 [Ruditapes philippinarum]|uniref:uncharacterized protein LOC132715689 isoform X2 n=1 Tax=Ruditapes philippinarum TaxID=129788 RepID=UPI00295B9956|nr:uncharacterized protein LOC132715689 isoform X2 [Ruditapes philippinarum]